MTTITLIQSLLDKNISTITSPSIAMDIANQISSTSSLDMLDGGIVSDYTVKGNQLIYKDPILSNGGVEYQFRGSMVTYFNSFG